jgi:hypothetical protein
MSFFTEEFTDLRTNSEFNNFVDDTSVYQSSQSYSDVQQLQLQREIDALRAHICKIITTHFNATNTNEFNVSGTDLIVYVGNLPNADIVNLRQSLIGKGYIVTINNDGTRMTISSTNN